MKTIALAEAAAIVALGTTLLQGQYLGTALSFLALVLVLCIDTAVRTIRRGIDREGDQ